MPEFSPEAKQIFNEARKLPAEQRAAFLDTACGGDATLRAQVEDLLAAYRAAGTFLESPTFEPADRAGPDSQTRLAEETPGTVIGRYKLLQPIGEGGFGRVFMAEQTEPVVRRVALKIIKLGMDTRQVIARFEAERQALAMMDHPNIAKVLDAGATPEGRPFFVMELVRGEPITDYCDKNNLDVPQRLELFSQVCNAVQHAHQKGIIHRDIKPTNVLVTIADGKPVPKVIDFGIAKATSARLTEKTLFTEFRHLIGTPAYMSPEQAEASGVDIDTRSDIYSLGVLLYELLTGTTPFDAKRLHSAAYAEIQRIIREEEPPKPSTRLSTLETLPAVAAQRQTEPAKLSKTIRGDLDWIVMKCLEKDRTRRYETANALAQEIERHLNDEPVLAGPPSTAYLLRKFIRRNMIPVTAAAAVGLALVLGVIGTSIGFVNASHQREQAKKNELRALDEAKRAQAAEEAERQRAQELEQVATFHAAQFEGLDAQAMGLRLREDLIEDAIQALQKLGHSDEELATTRAQLEEALAAGNPTNVALENLYENVLSPALQSVQEQFAAQPLVKARLLMSLANTLRQLGLDKYAMAPTVEALETRRRLLKAGHHDTIDAVWGLAGLLQSEGRLEEAEIHYREALKLSECSFDSQEQHNFQLMMDLAALLVEQNRLAEAESLMKTGLPGLERIHGEADVTTLAALRWYSGLLRMQGRPREAEPYVAKALDAAERAGEEGHAERQLLLTEYALLLFDLTEYEKAEPYHAAALNEVRRLRGDRHPLTLGVSSTYGVLLAKLGRFEEAESCLRTALALSREVLGDQHPDTLNVLGLLADALLSQGRYSEAEALSREQFTGCQVLYGEDHHQTSKALKGVAFAIGLQGRLDEAKPLFEEALLSHRRLLGDFHLDTLVLIQGWGYILTNHRMLDEAETVMAAYARGASQAVGDHKVTASLERHYAQTLAELGRFDEAIRFANAAVERYRRHPEWGPAGARHARQVLAGSRLKGFVQSIASGQIQDDPDAVELVRRELLEGFDGSPYAEQSHLGTAVLALLQARAYDAAEVFARRTVLLRQMLFPADHPEEWLAWNAKSLLGGALLGQSIRDLDTSPQVAEAKLEEASPLLVESAQWMRGGDRVPPPSQTGGDRVAEAVSRVVELYDTWNLLAPAAGHDQQAASWRQRLADAQVSGQQKREPEK